MIMFAEVRQDNIWSKVDKQFKSTFKELDGQFTDRVFDGRDRNLEAFLNNNSYATNMPLDVSEEIKSNKYLQGVVNCIALKELLDLNWDKEVCKTGCISEWQYGRIKNNSDHKPARIFTEPFWKDVEVVSPFKMDLIINNPILRTGLKYYVQYKYDETTIREQCKFFCEETIPTLIKLIPDGGTVEDVRIIFSI